MAIKTINIGGRDIKVDTSIADRLVAANQAKLTATGTPIKINQAFRTNEQQAELHRRSLLGEIGRAAPAGMSFHETGKAVDVTNLDESQSFLNRYGLRNDLSDDKGHFSYGETQDVKFENFADSVEKGRQRGFTDTQLLSVFSQKHPEQAEAIQTARSRYGTDSNIKNDRDLTNFLALRYSGVGKLQTPSVALKEDGSLAPEEKEKKKNFFQRVKEDIDIRAQKITDAFEAGGVIRDTAKEQSDAETILQAGLQAPLLVVDTIFEGIVSAGRGAVNVAKFFLPKEAEKFVRRKVDATKEDFFEDVGQVIKGFDENIYERAKRDFPEFEGFAEKYIESDRAKRNLVVGEFLLELATAGEAKVVKEATKDALQESVEMLAKKGKEFEKRVTGTVGDAVVAGGEKATGVTKFGVSQATGLSPETINDIIKNPEFFAKDVMSAIDREQVAKDVVDVVKNRIEALSDTGKAYTAIRESGASVSLPKNFIQDILAKDFNLDIVDGKISANTKSATRNNADISRMQNIVDDWGDKTVLQADEFLNLRGDLAELAKFDALSGKTQASQDISKSLRAELNKSRDQIEGLEELDNVYSKELGILKDIKKDIFKGDGTLKDNYISVIANLTGKGKEQKLERMKVLVPGIERELKILKAIEDIEAAKGQKVGTYSRAVLAGGGLATLNVPAIIAAIVATPSIAVEVLRKYAAAVDVSEALLDSTVTALENGKPLVGRQKTLFNGMINFDTKKLKQWADEAKVPVAGASRIPGEVQEQVEAVEEEQ